MAKKKAKKQRDPILVKCWEREAERWHDLVVSLLGERVDWIPEKIGYSSTRYYRAGTFQRPATEHEGSGEFLGVLVQYADHDKPNLFIDAQIYTLTEMDAWYKHYLKALQIVTTGKELAMRNLCCRVKQLTNFESKR